MKDFLYGIWMWVWVWIQEGKLRILVHDRSSRLLNPHQGLEDELVEVYLAFQKNEVSEVLQLRFLWLFSLLYDDLGGGLAISLCSEQLHGTTSSEIVKAEPYCGYLKACKCMMHFTLPKRPVLG